MLRRRNWFSLDSASDVVVLATLSASRPFTFTTQHNTSYEWGGASFHVQSQGRIGFGHGCILDTWHPRRSTSAGGGASPTCAVAPFATWNERSHVDEVTCLGIRRLGGNTVASTPGIATDDHHGGEDVAQRVPVHPLDVRGRGGKRRKRKSNNCKDRGMVEVAGPSEPDGSWNHTGCPPLCDHLPGHPRHPAFLRNLRPDFKAHERRRAPVRGKVRK